MSQLFPRNFWCNETKWIHRTNKGPAVLHAEFWKTIIYEKKAIKWYKVYFFLLYLSIWFWHQEITRRILRDSLLFKEISWWNARIYILTYLPLHKNTDRPFSLSSSLNRTLWYTNDFNLILLVPFRLVIPIEWGLILKDISLAKITRDPPKQLHYRTRWIRLAMEPGPAATAW